MAAPRSVSISAVSEDGTRDNRQSKANDVAAAATISPTKSDHLNETTSDETSSGVPASRTPFSNERDERKREGEVEGEEEVVVEEEEKAEEEKERLIGNLRDENDSSAALRAHAGEETVAELDDLKGRAGMQHPSVREVEEEVSQMHDVSTFNPVDSLDSVIMEDILSVARSRESLFQENDASAQPEPHLKEEEEEEEEEEREGLKIPSTMQTVESPLRQKVGALLNAVPATAQDGISSILEHIDALEEENRLLKEINEKVHAMPPSSYPHSPKAVNTGKTAAKLESTAATHGKNVPGSLSTPLSPPLSDANARELRQPPRVILQPPPVSTMPPMRVKQ